MSMGTRHERSESAATASDRGSTPTVFDAFVLLLTFLSLANIVLMALTYDDETFEIVLITDSVLSIVFIADFLVLLRRAPSKRRYFFRGMGWLDLLGGLPLPGARIARVARIVRAIRVMRRFGLRRLGRSALEDRAGTSLVVAVFLTIVVLQYGSICVLLAERGAENANIKTASDALWWSYVSITTVGYGDRYPVTGLGRSIGAAVLTIGVGLFGVLTGFLAKFFLDPRRVRGDRTADPQADIRAELQEISRQLTVQRGMAVVTTRPEAIKPDELEPAATTSSGSHEPEDGGV
jgi:voltage-gated potassium channel